jgi:hypothetical protein
MALQKKRRVLYFINGTTPSDDERRDAEQYGSGVLFRNARYVKDDATVEPFDQLAGPAIPDSYKRYAARETPALRDIVGFQQAVGQAAGQSPITARTAPHSPQKGVELPRPAHGEGDARDPQNVPRNPDPDNQTTNFADETIDNNKNRQPPVTPNGKPEGMPAPVGTPENPVPVTKVETVTKEQALEKVDPKSTKSDDQIAEREKQRVADQTPERTGKPVPALKANSSPNRPETDDTPKPQGVEHVEPAPMATTTPAAPASGGWSVPK